MDTHPIKPLFWLWIPVIWMIGQLAAEALGSFYVAAEKISKMHFDVRIFQRASEVEELYLFFFVLLYMIILQSRILAPKDKGK